MRMRDLDLNWYGAGAILSPLIGERYAFFAGSLDPDEATPEGADGILHIDVPD